MRLQWMVEGEYEEIWWSGRGGEGRIRASLGWRRLVEMGGGDGRWRATTCNSYVAGAVKHTIYFHNIIIRYGFNYKVFKYNV